MPRGKIEATAEQWQERVRRWKESGLSAAKFAEQEGITRPQSLWWWSNKLSRPRESPDTKLKLVQVTPVESPSAKPRKESGSGHVEVRFGGFTISVSSGFDTDTFRQVVEALERTR